MFKSISVLHICGQLKTGGIKTFIKSLINLNNKSNNSHDLLIIKECSKETSDICGEIYCLSNKITNFFKSLIQIKKIIEPYKAVFIHTAHPIIVFPLIFSDKKILLFQHGMTVSHGPFLKRFLKKLWLSFVVVVLNATVICSSEFAKEKMKNQGIVISKKRIITIPFGIEIHEKEGKIRSIKEKDSITIGMANILVPDKRNDLVIKSLSSYENKLKILIKIAGNGPDMMYLKGIANTIKNEKVCIEFLGDLTDMDSFYQQLDCFILPSKNESFGLVILEALSRFIPVVVFSDVGACLHFIEEYKNGVVIKGEQDGLRRFWENLNNNPAIISSLSKYISKMNMQKYDILNTRIKLDNLIRN